MHEDNNQEKPEHGPMVTIIIDNKSIQIHRGHRSVAEIKIAGGVPLAYDLEQVIHGKLVPLPDGGSVTIKGEEQFVSHPKDSQAS
ncbi:MAG: hypothetical protein WCW53_03790 [Syntrophales bacterium]|jgi:hypothetical protein